MQSKAEQQNLSKTQWVQPVNVHSRDKWLVCRCPMLYYSQWVSVHCCLLCLPACMHIMYGRNTQRESERVCPVQTGCSLHPSAHHMSWR